jgi:hypothetical protein
MPLLGYFGYIPFGVLVWQVFIWSGKMFNFDSQILILPLANNSSKQPIAAKVPTQS